MSHQPSEKKSTFSRRNFVKKGALGGAAVGLSPLGVPLVNAVEKAPKGKLKVGVVGL